MDKVILNRDPSLMQKHELAQIQMNHDLNDNYDVVVKATYTTRDYNHMGDNDYNKAVAPFPGLFHLDIRRLLFQCNGKVVSADSIAHSVRL